MANFTSFNETSNSSGQWNGHSSDHHLQIAMTTVYAITFVPALLGNVFVLYAVSRYNDMRTTTNVLIANMAVGDLITTVLAMPYSVAYLYVQSRWFGGIVGTVTCKLLHFFVAMTISASIFALFLISLERYCAVVFPLRYIKVINNKKFLSAVIWVLSCAVMSIYLIVHRTRVYPDGTYLCQLIWRPEFDKVLAPKVFYSLVALLLYFGPLCLIFGMHYRIIRKLWYRQVPGNQSAANNRTAKRSTRSVIKMLIVVLVLFAICWIPVHIMHMLINFDYQTFKTLPPPLVMVSFWVSHLNSAINPYIFITMNESFRNVALGFLCNTGGKVPRSTVGASSTFYVKTRESRYQEYELDSGMNSAYPSHSSRMPSPASPIKIQNRGSTEIGKMNDAFYL